MIHSQLFHECLILHILQEYHIITFLTFQINSSWNITNIGFDRHITFLVFVSDAVLLKLLELQQKKSG